MYILEEAALRTYIKPKRLATYAKNVTPLRSSKDMYILLFQVPAYIFGGVFFGGECVLVYWEVSIFSTYVVLNLGYSWCCWNTFARITLLPGWEDYKGNHLLERQMHVAVCLMFLVIVLLVFYVLSVSFELTLRTVLSVGRNILEKKICSKWLSVTIYVFTLGIRGQILERT